MQSSLPAERRSIDNAAERMHQRLIAWGRLYLRSGDNPMFHVRAGADRNPGTWDSDEPRIRHDFGSRHYDDARALHHVVIALPRPAHSLLLQRFYRDDNLPMIWDQLGPARLAIVSKDIADDVNRTLRGINAHAATPWRLIEATDIEGIRWRAIQAVIDAETTRTRRTQ